MTRKTTREKLPVERLAHTHKFTILVPQEPDKIEFVMKEKNCQRLIELLKKVVSNINSKENITIDYLLRWIDFFENLEPSRETLKKVKGYLTLGFYDDGRIGEIFVKMDRQGSRVSGFVDSWAVTMSLLLQSGFPLKELCQRFIGMQFNPAGHVEGKPFNERARSPVDYICRYLLNWEKREKLCGEENIQ